MAGRREVSAQPALRWIDPNTSNATLGTRLTGSPRTICSRAIGEGRHPSCSTDHPESLRQTRPRDRNHDSRTTPFQSHTHVQQVGSGVLC